MTEEGNITFRDLGDRRLAFFDGKTITLKMITREKGTVEFPLSAENLAQLMAFTHDIVKRIDGEERRAAADSDSPSLKLESGL